MLFTLLLTSLVTAVAATTSDAPSSAPHDDYFNTYSPIVYGSPQNFNVFCYGNCGVDKTGCTTSPGTVMMGGGVDVDDAFKWMINRAGGGDFVFIRDVWADAYNPYVYDMAVQMGKPLNSVISIFFNGTAGAYDTKIQNIVKGAEALFFGGGDQSDYIKYFTGTPMQEIFQSKVPLVPVGGTSAGCMVLSGLVYTAMAPSGTGSATALSNPYDETLTLGRDFLKMPYLSYILADTHFVTRNRMGRLLTFIARAKADYGCRAYPLIYGVGIDVETALLVDTDGSVKVIGSGTAYICKADHNAQVVKANTSLTYTGIPCQRLDAETHNTYSFKTFPSNVGVKFNLDVKKGVFSKPGSLDPYGPGIPYPSQEPTSAPTKPTKAPVVKPTKKPVVKPTKKPSFKSVAKPDLE